MQVSRNVLQRKLKSKLTKERTEEKMDKNNTVSVL